MKEPNYFEAITHAWRLVWNNKIIWILGILAVFVGQFGLGDFIGKMWISAEQVLSVPGSYTMSLLVFLPVVFVGHWVYFLWFLVIMSLVLVFIAFLAVTAQGTLISASGEYYHDKKFGKITKHWQTSLKNFWGILGINVLQKFLLASLFLLMLYVWRYFYQSGFAVAPYMIVLDITIALFLGLLISAVSVYALGYKVIENKNFVESLQSGFRLFKNHMLVSLELSILLMFLGLILVSFMSFAAIIAFLPSLLVWFLAAVSASYTLVMLGLGFGVLFFLFIIILSAGIFNAFVISAWMYMFSRMHHEGVISKLRHTAQRIIHIFKN